MRDKLTDATIQAVKSIRDERFFATERGFHGRLYCALLTVLSDVGIVDGHRILEMEYQKSRNVHGLVQRPDIVLHVPAEVTNADVSANNLAVWALKRHASEAEALDDFGKLDQMFATLQYHFGFFVNIADFRHYSRLYSGPYADRLVCIAAQLDRAEVTVIVQPGQVW
jgi:hypothetical protein